MFSSPTTWFPLLSKELIELANRRRTYVIRFVYTAFLFSIGLLILYGRRGLPTDPAARLGEGREMFEQLAWLQLAGIYLFLPAMTSAAFTGEKERDTLTLLLLTTMPPWTIILQKYLSRVIPMLCYVILSFPLMAISYSYGGVTTEALYFTMVILALSVFHVAAVSLMSSAFCRTTVESFLASYGLLAISGTCCPIFSPIQVMIFGMGNQKGLDIFTSMLMVIASTVVALLLSRGFLISRAFVPPRNFLLEFFQALDRMFQEMNHVTGGVVLVDDGNALPDDKPVAWRETAKKSLGTFRYLFRVLVLLELPILFVAQQVRLSAFNSRSIVTNLYYAVWVIGGAMICIHASSLVSSERSRQTFDSLLTSPVPGRSLLLQKLAGVQRLLNVLLIPLLTIIFFNHWLRDYGNDYRYLIMSVATAVILPRMITWIAFLIGLKMKSQMRAVFTSLAVVATFAGISAVAQLLMGAFGLNLPSWLAGTLSISPGVLIEKLESWYILERSQTPEFLWEQTIVVSIILTIYLGIWWGLRFYGVRNADRLLGRMPEKRHIAENATIDLASQPA